MTTLLRKMLKTHSKHKKLCEEAALAEYDGEGWWREVKDEKDKADVRYAGAVPVERAASAPATALAVRAALQTYKSKHKKIQKVNLDISPKGIIVTDAETEDNVISVSIYKISYCSADAANARVFAVVEGKTNSSSKSGDTHVAHVFVCSKRRHARALALSLAHAFNDAYQSWQATQASSLHSADKRLAPWVNFPDDDDDDAEDSADTEHEQWHTIAPLVTFA